MPRPVPFLRALVLVVCCLAGPAGAAPFAVRLIGVAALPAGTEIDGVRVGGLSGIDYDAAADRWLAISDDRSERGPARFYTVKLDYDEKAVRSSAVTAATVLRQPDGTPYPGRPEFVRSGDVPDFESLRLDPRSGEMWYTSEGDAALRLQPFVRRATRDGAYRGSLPLPEMFLFSAQPGRGARANLTLESLTFAPDGGSVWLAPEAPLQQDGAVAAADHGAVTRLTHLDRDGAVLAQYAYPLDPWQLTPAEEMRGDNGLSEMLALADGHLLTLERTGVAMAGRRWRYAARIYEVTVDGATDVRDRPALAETTAPYRPVAKRLVFDFARAGQPWVDNLEGLAWGRRLPNGHATLVVVSDDNFMSGQVTQFWVFEVLSLP